MSLPTSQHDKLKNNRNLFLKNIILKSVIFCFAINVCFGNSTEIILTKDSAQGISSEADSRQQPIQYNGYGDLVISIKALKLTDGTTCEPYSGTLPAVVDNTNQIMQERILFSCKVVDLVTGLSAFKKDDTPRNYGFTIYTDVISVFPIPGKNWRAKVIVYEDDKTSQTGLRLHKIETIQIAKIWI